MRFPVIVCDPPWRFECWTEVRGIGGHGVRDCRRVEGHYKTQKVEWIEALPVQDITSDNCTLLLWATWPLMPQAFALIEAWGFTYKTLAFDWIKPTQAGTPRMGLGYWTRANSEPCLLATRGKPKRMDKGVSQVLACGTGRHSEKPFEFYDRVERLLEGPYIELFARPHGSLMDGERPGWTRIGNEITGNSIEIDLARIAAG